jgi:hypothetical protein
MFRRAASEGTRFNRNEVGIDIENQPSEFYFIRFGIVSDFVLFKDMVPSSSLVSLFSRRGLYPAFNKNLQSYIYVSYSNNHAFALHNNNIFSSMKSVAMFSYYFAFLVPSRWTLDAGTFFATLRQGSSAPSRDSSLGREKHPERHIQRIFLPLNLLGIKIPRIAGSICHHHGFHQHQQQQHQQPSPRRYFSSSSAHEPAALLYSDLSFDSEDRDELFTKQDAQAEDHNQRKLSDVRIHVITDKKINCMTMCG